MDKVEYNVLKKQMKTSLGADDAESLTYYADQLENKSRMFKRWSIIMGVISLPLCWIVVGIPILIASLLLYFVVYKTAAKRAEIFREHIQNDSDLSVA